MVLSRLNLQNFRNYKTREFEFSPKLTLIIGPNTAGKTNLLEALYLIATGSSFRGKIDREMIKLGEELARLQVRLKEDSEEMLLEIVLTTGLVQGRRSSYKRYLVNGVGRRRSDFGGSFFAVLFHPQDIELVTDSPSRRREFLDNVLVQTSREYTRTLTEYEKALRRRNKLLSRLQEQLYNQLSRDSQIYNNIQEQMEYWDRLLVESGQVLTEERKRFIEFLNSKELSKNLAHVRLDFRQKLRFQLEYVSNLISYDRLEKYGEREIAVGYTLVGPHRDDFVIQIEKVKLKNENNRDLSAYGSRGEPQKESFLLPRSMSSRRKSDPSGQVAAIDLAKFGSRGQQRLAVLWLRLGELAYLEDQTGEKPVLLLDDIFSELDHEHRRLVASIIPDYQTIITTADEHFIKNLENKNENMKIIELNIARGSKHEAGS